MQCGQRVKQVCEMLKLTQAEFGEKLGFKWDKIKNIETNIQKLTPEVALDIEAKFKFNFRWLLTGQGPMTAEKVGEIQAPYTRGTADPITAQIAAIVSRLPEKKRLQALKEMEEMQENEEMREALKRLGRLETKAVKQAGCITLNLLYIMAFPPMIVLTLVGYQIITGPDAVNLLNKMYLFYLPAIVSMFIYWRSWYMVLKSKYVSVVSFNRIGDNRAVEG